MQRPTSLTVIGWLLIVFGLFGLASQMMVSNNSVAQQIIAESPMPASVHMAMGVIGALIGVACGYGVLKGLNWSRYLYIGWGIVALIFGLFTTLFTSMLLISVLFIAVFAFFLFRPAANAWFTGGSATQAG